MGCCEDIPIDDVYIPLSTRLVDYGTDSYGEQLLNKFPHTHMWIFSFYKDEELCIDCEQKFADMAGWFTKYGLLEDSLKNVKWVVDDDVDNNLILKDLAIQKTPLHLFSDEHGKIIDVVFGFPSPQWLEKHILPLIRNDVI